VEDAETVHQVMISAFEEYRHSDVPSSALFETVDGIKKALQTGEEKALLYFEDNVAVGTVRFTVGESDLYFFRLSVCPKARGKGIAKSMLSWLENDAKEHGKSSLSCKVRSSIPKNVQLYKSLGYRSIEKQVLTSHSGLPIETITVRKTLIFLKKERGNPFPFMETAHIRCKLFWNNRNP